MQEATKEKNFKELKKYIFKHLLTNMHLLKSFATQEVTSKESIKDKIIKVHKLKRKKKGVKIYKINIFI